MAEQHAGEARQSLPNEAENSSSAFAELLKEMRAINNNITLMHEDINNLVVVDDAAQSSDETEGNGDDLSGVANPERNEEERAETSSVLSVDAKVAHLLKSTQTSREENATSSRNTLLPSIAEDLTVSEKTGDAVQQDLANIVASLFKERLPEEKVQSKLAKYPRPQNIENFVTPRVNPSIWNNITASARSTDVKYQKLQQSMLGAIGAMTYAADHAIKNNCDKTLITALTDGIAMATQCHHELNHTRRLVMKKDLNQDLAAVCNTAIPSGEFLFGDLSKLTKDIAETNKLTKKARPSQSVSHGRPRAAYRSSFNNNENRRFQPYQRSRRGHFLDRGRSQGPRRKKEGPTTK